MENKKFRNKYKIESARLKEYDYSSDGVYFITICVKDKKLYFGNIYNGKMQLNVIGKIAKKYWENIPRHFDFVSLDEFVVMPDHIHGIIWINKNENDCAETRHGVYNMNTNKKAWVEMRHGVYNMNTNKKAWVETRHGVYNMNTNKKAWVETRHGASLPGNNKFGKLKKFSLQLIINHYKGAVTRWANKNKIPFAWQPRYYDHVIWNENELNNIRQYIIDNPFKWRNFSNK